MSNIFDDWSNNQKALRMLDEAGLFLDDNDGSLRPFDIDFDGFDLNNPAFG